MFQIEASLLKTNRKPVDKIIIQILIKSNVIINEICAASYHCQNISIYTCISKRAFASNVYQNNV